MARDDAAENDISQTVGRFKVIFDRPLNVDAKPNPSSWSGGKQLFDLVSANLGLLRTAMWNSDEQSVSLRHEKPRASALRRVDLGQTFIAICVGLLDDVDFARATDSVQAMALPVIKDIVGIAGDVDVCNHGT